MISRKESTVNTFITMMNSLVEEGVAIMGTELTGNLTITANDIVFPAAYHWNMLNVAGTNPIIQPNDFVTLYLGVSSPVAGSVHTLIVLAGTQEFVFELQR